MPVAGLELRVQHQAQVADPVGVDGMARAPRLVRVVADHGTVLATVQRLDGGVAIQYPRCGAGLSNAVPELLLHPLHRACELGLLRRALLGRVLLIGLWRDGTKGATQAVVTDDLGHPEDARGHPIAAQYAHMRIAAMPVQDPQHPRPEHIHQLGRVRARVAQRAAPEPGLKQPAGLQVLGKEGQLAQRRGTASLIPAHREHASRGLYPHRFVRCLDHRPDGLLACRSYRLDCRFALTHRVPPRLDLKPSPSRRLQQGRTGQLRKIG